MIYEFGQESPLQIMRMLSERVRKRRLEKGYSRKFLSEASGVPVASIIRFEKDAAISLESFVKIAQTLGYNESLKSLLAIPQYSTMEELETINKNQSRKRGDKTK